MKLKASRADRKRLKQKKADGQRPDLFTRSLQSQVSAGNLPRPRFFTCDENGPYVYGFFAVKDGTVNIEYQREGEADNVVFEKVKTMYPSAESGTYLNVFRLYENGRAQLMFWRNAPNADEQARYDAAMKLGTEAVENLYDDLFIEHADKFKTLVAEVVEYAQDTNHQSRAEADYSKTLFQMVKEREPEYLSTGNLGWTVGWMLPNGRAFYIVPAPMPKYRAGRAFAEIAQKLGAKAVLFITDGYLRDEQGKRVKNVETLMGSLIAPDGSSLAYAGGEYRKTAKKIITTKPIELGDNFNELGEQYFIPAWNTKVVNHSNAMMN